jgi:hypothetical protein
MTWSFGKFCVICLTKVDFPAAIPPVNPNILTFFNFLMTKNIKRQGINVVNNGFMSINIVFARQYLHYEIDLR